MRRILGHWVRISEAFRILCATIHSISLVFEALRFYSSIIPFTNLECRLLGRFSSARAFAWVSICMSNESSFYLRLCTLSTKSALSFLGCSIQAFDTIYLYLLLFLILCYCIYFGCSITNFSINRSVLKHLKWMKFGLKNEVIF